MLLFSLKSTSILSLLNKTKVCVLVSKSTQWDYAYRCVPGETPLSNVMHHSAVSTKESNIAKLEIGEINVETKVQTSDARMSIQNLLNPSTPSPTKYSDTPLVTHSGNDKRKKLAPQALDGTSLATSTWQPKASEYSKLVALIIKDLQYFH
ncbi:hypothetical protein VP01_6920g2 [Puccinia sorghi]|uniref:Uncharacterized protein n=1 Tax=Puccinia sorghi TaxID=27349 RepID=A0A0L6UE70_9BASI|nr:hypothetical protein VP01_6920g2 [Puccinia sorghi]